MKCLLQINVTAQGGSTGAIVENIACAAKQNGWEAWTLFGRGDPGNEATGIKMGSRLDQIGHSLLARIADHHGEYSRRATCKAIERIREIKPDVLHLHVLHGYYINYNVLFDYLAKADIPTVWTLHDCWPFTGRCVYFEQQGCDRWKNGCGECPSKGVYPKSLFDATHASWLAKQRAFAKPNNLVLAPVSNWMAGFLKDSFLKDCKYRTIYNAVDTTTFRPIDDATKNAIKGKRLLLGVAMFWNKRKGLQDYIALDALLPDDCAIGLVGLEAPIAGTRIVPLGKASATELAKWYSAAEITLNLSYEESFGMTTPESLSCGTQVIAYDRSASPELLDDTVGAVVHAGDIHALAETVRQLLSNPKPPETCRNYALTRFALNKQTDAYLALYEEMTKVSTLSFKNIRQ